MELIEQLKQDGIAKGLCQPWQNKLRDGVSVKRLVDLYVRGIDFCIKNDYPTLDFIRENFKGKCEPYGVYIDKRDLNLREQPNVVLLGGCKGALSYGGYSVCRAFIRHQSEATIKVSGYACVTIDVYDDSLLNLVTVGDHTRVWVKVYGKARINHTGQGIKVKYITSQ